MAHDLPLLGDIAIALLYALIGGSVAKRLKLPPLVGYLLAGVAIGPFTPGFNGHQETIQTLAELGVVFLLFGVGLHFSFSDLWSVRSIALPGAFLQMVLSAAMGFGLAQMWGWTRDASLLLGLSISVASTVVLLRALMDNALLDSVHGRVAVGWLVFQDLATVALLILLPAILSRESDPNAPSTASALTGTVVFLALMLGAGRRVVPWLLRRIVWLQSRELFILVGLTLAVGTALLASSLFGVSLALGAFIAGVVVSESPYSHQVGADLLPFREAFAVIFFVSVGMLVNPPYLMAHWREVAALSGLVVIGNALIGAGTGFLFPYPARTALVVGAGLSQIGEFSFIVGQTGMALGVLDASQYSLILAAALVSITLNTFMFKLLGPAERVLRAKPALWQWLDRHGPQLAAPKHLQDHVVIVGWGRVGRHVANVLGTLGVPRLVIESDSTLAEQLAREHVPTLFGEAGNSEILSHADLPRAQALVLTVPDEPTAAIAVDVARKLSPDLHIIARASTAEGARHLVSLGANEIVRPELEGGLQILHRTLANLGYPFRRIYEYSDAIRRQELAPGAVHVDEPRLAAQLAASDLDLQWLPISEASPLAGRSIGDSTLRKQTGASIVAVAHQGTVTSNPGPDQTVAVGDEIALIGTASQLEAARALMETS